MAWYLDRPDVTLFDTSQEMRLPVILNQMVPTGPATPTPGITVSIGSATSARGAASLDVHNASFPVNFYGDPHGHITLAPNVALGISVAGTIRPVSPIAPRGGSLSFALQHFSVSDTDLTIGDVGLRTGAIHVDNVHDGSLTMLDSMPQVLDLQVRQATARNINWTLPP